jgi:hypothetical protein
MKDKVSPYNKALVAALSAIVTAVVPQLLDAVEDWAVGVGGVLMTAVLVWLVPNKQLEGTPLPPPPPVGK